MKQQFDLETWLGDKSKKITTRNGKQVRIICWDSPNKVFPIVGFIEDNLTPSMWDSFGYFNSSHINSPYDLFFTNEENEKEFTNRYQFNSILHILDLKAEIFKKQGNQEEYERWCGYYDWLKSKKELIIPNSYDDPKPQKKSITGENELGDFESLLVDLVSNWCDSHVETAYEYVRMYSSELKLEFDKKIRDAYNQGGLDTQEEILKDLPKWRKTDTLEHKGLIYGQLIDGDHYLDIKELKEKLPKEE